MEIAGQKEHKIISLFQTLEQLAPIKIEYGGKYAYTGISSNDLKVEEKVSTLKATLEDLSSKTQNLKIGLVIASGGILSLGKEFPQIDLWIVLDKTPSLISNMKRYSIAVSSAANPQEILDLATEFGGTQQNMLTDEGESYGQYHYLKDQESLKRTQEFLRKKKVVFMNADLLDAEFMAKVGKILKDQDAEIAFANFTNVMEWLPGYDEHTSAKRLSTSLEAVPFSEKCAILFSVSQGGFGLRGKVGRSPLNTRTAVGFLDYLEKSNQ